MLRSPTFVHTESFGANRAECEAESLSKPPEPPARRSAVANAVLYGSINGVVAVPAMVSFVAIIFQARWRALAYPSPEERMHGMMPSEWMAGMCISFVCYGPLCILDLSQALSSEDSGHTSSTALSKQMLLHTPDSVRDWCPHSCHAHRRTSTSRT